MGWLLRGFSESRRPEAELAGEVSVLIRWRETEALDRQGHFTSMSDLDWIGDLTGLSR
jgi:hypothetical protein